MKAIYKYPVPLSTEKPTRMPRGAQFLSLQMQNDIPCIWAIVDLSQPNEERPLYWITGQPMPQGFHNYVGTIQTGPYVFHLFEFFNETQ
jgi:hypothetical protein